MHAWFRGHGRAALLLGAALLAGVGCSEILGLEEWSEPPRSTSNGNGTTCADGLRNGVETDIDCGGDSCLPCAVGQQCATDADCETSRCGQGGVCEDAPPQPACQPVNPDNPSCADCELNGAETDIDCGGDCQQCGDGKKCDSDVDCDESLGLRCDVGGTCAALPPPTCVVDPENATCGDCVLGLGETDIDCGGDACPPCDPGKACLTDADCADLVCANAICE